MAACSSARSAYIRLSLACSASSSRSCRTSHTDAPPYLLRHLKNVALLTPCVRHRSGTGTPLSASRRTPTIWVSLNLDFRMTAPWTRAVYVQLSIDRGSLRAEFKAQLGAGSDDGGRLPAMPARADQEEHGDERRTSTGAVLHNDWSEESRQVTGTAAAAIASAAMALCMVHLLDGNA